MGKLFETYLSIVKKVFPEKDKGSSMGLDISETTCKMVELIKSGDSYELLNFSVVPIKPGALKETIQSIFQSAVNPSTNLYTAVLGKGTLIRYIDMPRMSLEDLRRSIDVEADKYFPFPKDQIYTDCYILDSRGSDNKMPVLIAASRKSIIDERIKLLSEAGLPADFISLNPIALANALHVLGGNGASKNAQNTEPGSTAVAVLDIGETVSTLLITVDNLPRFTRDVHIGGAELTKRIANSLGITMEEAEKLKLNQGEQKQDVLNACEAVLLNLITEIRLSFDYFTTEYNFQINKLLLVGGTSRFDNVIEFFANHLGIEVERWDPLNFVKLGTNVSQEDAQKYASRLSVAFGLALYQFE
jgi:type IV pilus assembly protein PilM